MHTHRHMHAHIYTMVICIYTRKHMHAYYIYTMVIGMAYIHIDMLFRLCCPLIQTENNFEDCRCHH